MELKGEAAMWALHCRHGYVMRWIEGFGPAMTQNEAEALTFPTKAEAIAHPAFRFPMMFLEPVEIAR